MLIKDIFPVLSENSQMQLLHAIKYQFHNIDEYENLLENINFIKFAERQYIYSQTDKDGNIYSGEFKNGVPHGKGKILLYS